MAPKNEKPESVFNKPPVDSTHKDAGQKLLTDALKIGSSEYKKYLEKSKSKDHKAPDNTVAQELALHAINAKFKPYLKDQAKIVGYAKHNGKDFLFVKPNAASKDVCAVNPVTGKVAANFTVVDRTWFGLKETSRANGEKTTAYTLRGEKVSEATTNQQGRIVDVKDKDGKGGYQVTYKPDGKTPSSFTDRIHSKTWTVDPKDETHWTTLGSQEHYYGTVSVDAAGIHLVGGKGTHCENTTNDYYIDCSRKDSNTKNSTYRREDSQGRLTEIQDNRNNNICHLRLQYNGNSRDISQYEYAGHDGSWTSKDNKTWTCKDSGKSNIKPGQTREASILVNDGHLSWAKVQETNRTPSGAPAPNGGDQPANDSPNSRTAGKSVSNRVDSHDMEMTAEAIRNATGNDNYVARWADREKINDLLKNKTEAERLEINKLYQQKYGKTLDQEIGSFETGSDLEKFKNVLYRKDGNIETQTAGRIHQSLGELNETRIISGRSTHEIEKDLRDTVSTLNSKQLSQASEEYQKQYGITLSAAITNNNNLSSATKQALGIYINGNDKRTDNDTLRLATIGLEQAHIDIFQEAMRDASPEARKQFLDQGGEQKAKTAFGGHWYNALTLGLSGNVTDKELVHAQDYATQGKLDVTTQITDNAGSIRWTTNQKAIESAINNMTPEERALYIAGKDLAAGKTKDIPVKDKTSALEYYKKTFETIQRTGNPSDVSKWEDMIACQGGSLVTKLHAHAGTLYNDSSKDVTQEIAGMNKADWEFAKAQYASGRGAEYREQVKNALTNLKGFRIQQSDIDNSLAVFDKKMAASTFDETAKAGPYTKSSTPQDNSNSTDKIHSLVKEWGGSADIMAVLHELKPNDLARIKVEYANKYNSNFESDLLDKLGGEDKDYAKRLFRSGKTAQEQFNDSRDDYYKSRGGIGSGFTDSIGRSGTGYQLDDALNQYSKEIGNANRQFKSITPEQTKALQEHFHTALTGFKDSKATAANLVVNGTIATAAMASMVATGGADAPLLIAMAAGGAACKVSANAVLLGADYEPSVQKISVDAFTGAVDGFTACLGPAEVAALFKVGAKAATSAATGTIAELGEQGVKTLLRANGAEALEKGAKQIMQHTLASGAKEIDKKAIHSLAERTISNGLQGQAREAAAQQLATSLEKNLSEALKKQTENYFSSMIRQGALNAGGGSLAGGTAGFGSSVAEWDPAKSFQENMSHVAEATIQSAATATAMAGAFTLASHGIGKSFEVYKEIRSTNKDFTHFSRDYFVSAHGEQLEPNSNVVTLGRQQFGQHPGIDDTHLSLRRDENGSVFITDLSQDGTYIKRAGHSDFERLERDKSMLIGKNDEIRLGSQNGPKLELNEYPYQVTNGSDGTFRVADRKGQVRSYDAAWKITNESDGSVVVKDNVEEHVYGSDGSFVRRSNKEFLVQSSPVTPKFRSEVEQALLQLPLEIRRAAQKGGVRVILSDNVTEVLPDLSHLTPRGWNSGQTWSGATGLYSPGGRMALIAEKLKNSKYRPSNRVPGVLRHEFGHALDDALNQFSKSPAFREAYDKDVALIRSNMSRYSPKSLEYFLQQGDAGREEAMAELFGIHYGGGAANWVERQMRTAFPNTLELISQKLRQIESNP